MGSARRPLVGVAFPVAPEPLDHVPGTGALIRISITDEMPAWKTKYPGVESSTSHVMGCIVNGPGESKHANIGSQARQRRSAGRARWFVDGKKFRTLRARPSRRLPGVVSDYMTAYGAAPKRRRTVTARVGTSSSSALKSLRRTREKWRP